MSVVDWTHGAQHMWDSHKVATEEGMSLREGIERLAADADRLRRLAAASEVA